MKKIFTLFAGLLMAAAVMAADRGPSVTIQSNKNYKIVIDGKNYFVSSTTIHLFNLSNGMHSIRVFEMRKGLFVKGERLVSSSTFKVGRRDIAIKVDQFGRIDISKKKGNDHFSKGNSSWKKDGRKGSEKYRKQKNDPTHRF
ncbi:MAG TPA: hypothetical protein PKC72_06490 [Chitinophagaceae bacterium]|nr:hypothetical protein [Chitinophagaceae bacterium]